jgi:hypothetical protein
MESEAGYRPIWLGLFELQRLPFIHYKAKLLQDGQFHLFYDWYTGLTFVMECT